jgi:hypothetical protein
MYLDCTCGRQMRLGTITLVVPSGWCPNLAIRSSSSVADDAAKVCANGG